MSYLVTFLLFLLVFSSLSCVWLFDTPWAATHHTSLSLTVSQSLPKFMSIESVMLSYHLILCHPLLFLHSNFPSITVFSIESALHIRWPKYWSFSLSISPSIEYSGLISFRIDWFDLFADQGTLKGLFQHYNMKASILWCSAFFMVQISHPYMPTRKTTALTIQPFISKVTSLIFNTLSRFIIVFLPRSKHLLISWLKLLSAVILEPNKRKSVTVSTFFLVAIKWWDWMPWSLFFEYWVLNQLFHSPLSPSSRGSLILLSAIRVVPSAYLIWGCWYFSQQSWFQLVTSSLAFHVMCSA